MFAHYWHYQMLHGQLDGPRTIVSLPLGLRATPQLASWRALHSPGRLQGSWWHTRGTVREPGHPPAQQWLSHRSSPWWSFSPLCQSAAPGDGRERRGEMKWWITRLTCRDCFSVVIIIMQIPTIDLYVRIYGSSLTYLIWEDLYMDLYGKISTLWKNSTYLIWYIMGRSLLYGKSLRIWKVIIWYRRSRHIW